ETVDGERDVARGRDGPAPAFIEPPPIAGATVQQHDRRRRPPAAGLPQIALQWRRARQRRFQLDDSARGFRRTWGASDQKRGCYQQYRCEEIGHETPIGRLYSQNFLRVGPRHLGPDFVTDITNSAKARRPRISPLLSTHPGTA